MLLPLLGLAVVGWLLVRQGAQTSQAVQGAAQSATQAASATQGAAAQASRTLSSMQPSIDNANAISAQMLAAAKLFTQQAQALGLTQAQAQSAYQQGLTPSQFVSQLAQAGQAATTNLLHAWQGQS